MSKIFNHRTATLSELDLQMVHSVPPGGNWKDIPESIPSARLVQIRKSFAEGKGSRSTYYGRLHPDRPSYTIGTYFSRPGNGCFVHPSQDRVISQREAARLQSFPDEFEFFGSQRAVNQQIGNAVPPLLAWEVAKSLGCSGNFVDVFAGAGGLSLGFEWAGWRGLCATDIDQHAMSAYSNFFNHTTVVGDLREEEIVSQLIEKTQLIRSESKPLALIGGPPCQGFSTAGKKRTVKDDRNQLYKSYAKALKLLSPDYFVFENVAGILNMDGGKVISKILGHFGKQKYDLQVWKLNAVEFGVPQRRIRVFVIGTKKGRKSPKPPTPWTEFGNKSLLDNAPACTVSEAISDLPCLCPGEDGSCLDYSSGPMSRFQQLMRGMIDASEYKDGEFSVDSIERREAV